MNKKALIKAGEKLRFASDRGLKKTTKLTSLNDYRDACLVYEDLKERGCASTFIKTVADFYRRCGFKVELDPNNINYRIS